MFYSQCNEDKILYDRYFKNYKLEGQKYYLEMGAINGILYSNTKFYEDTLKWTGILIEPDPFQFCDLIKNRPNNKLMSVICSDQKDVVEFNICSEIPAVSSLKITEPSFFENFYYSKSQMIKTNFIPISLDTIIENSGIKRIDLCVIDVEGHEINVLKSFSFKIPVVLWLIEFLDDENKNNEVKNIMKKNNCKFMELCYHNAIFINNDYLQYFDLSNRWFSSGSFDYPLPS